MCAGFSWATGHQLPALVSFVYRCTFRLLQLCLSVFEVRAAFSGQPALWTTINTVEAGCACDTASCAHAKKASPSHYSVLRSPRGIRDPCIVETLYAVGALPSMAEADAGERAHMLDSRVGAADAVMDVASARRHGLSGAVPQPPRREPAQGRFPKPRNLAVKILRCRWPRRWQGARTKEPSESGPGPTMGRPA